MFPSMSPWMSPSPFEVLPVWGASGWKVLLGSKEQVAVRIFWSKQLNAHLEVIPELGASGCKVCVEWARGYIYKKKSQYSSAPRLWACFSLPNLTLICNWPGPWPELDNIPLTSTKCKQVERHTKNRNHSDDRTVSKTFLKTDRDA